MRKKLLIVLLAASLLVLAACQTTQPASARAIAPRSGEDHYTFGYTCMDGSNPFFGVILDTIREKVTQRGDELLVSDPDLDQDLQIRQVEDMLGQGLDGLFINPVDARLIKPALEAAQEQGVPMIGFDTEVADLSYLVSYTGSHNYNAGKVCGEDLVKKCPEGGDILVLDAPRVQSVVDRTNGFLDAIVGNGFHVLAQEDAKADREVAYQVALELFRTYPNVVAVFGGNDPTALGILQAAEELGVTNCKIYGVDGSPAFKQILAQGNTLLEGTGAQSPVAIAEKAVELMYSHLEGQELEDLYPVDTFLITADNVSEYGTDGWQ